MKMYHFLNKLSVKLAAAIFMLSSLEATAQNLCQGVVTDANQSVLIGASVSVKGKSAGTVTNADGRFILSNVIPQDSLVVSCLGYITATFAAGDATDRTLVLQESANALNEAVVTALGIKRDKKALGYAVQNVEGEELNTARRPNLLNNMAGRLAGVQVVGANNGIASSARIVIRGENSLNINNNSPLFVIDGVPINNDVNGVGGGSTNQGDMPTDYGNGAAEINPDDIESLNILRGAAASALYGARAANGVVVITTKSGALRKGLGVTVSSSALFNNVLLLPEQQTQYGGGWGLEYYADYGTNFGPAFSASRQVLQDGSPGFDNGTEEPFVFRYRLQDYFQTGLNLNNQVSIAGGNDRGTFRLSYANSYNSGVVPNTDLKRNNFNLNTTFFANKNFKIDLSATYIKSESDNLPVAGYGGQGIMYAILWNYANVDVDWLRNYWIEPDRVQRNIFTWADNPFLVMNEHINAFNKDRLFGRISANYQITPAWSLMMRIGTDYFDEFRFSRRPQGSVFYRNGMYREQNLGFQETNADFLLSYDKRLGVFSTRISAGGNQMDQRNEEGFIEGQGLAIPGIYTLGNINTLPRLNRYNGQKRVNSLYAFANVGYKDFIYLDVTARNDWSSTLPSNSNSYFYPSVSLSVIPTEMIRFGSKVDYVKARLNFARVGKDTDPFQLRRTYSFATLPNSVTIPDNLPNQNLQPEQTDSWETGIEAYFFKRRLTADLTFYNTVSTNQIISFAVSGASGYNSIAANAGKITNRGIEAVIHGTPVKTKNFEWRIGANFSANRSKVVELFADLDSYIIAEGPDGVTVEARPGGRMGDIYGHTYVRNPEGQIVFNTNGLPLLGPRAKVGNYNPDFMLGLSSGIQFRGLAFSCLFDIRQGGTIYSYTHAIGHESGILASSLPGREEGITGKGVVQNADGTYSPNTTSVDAETWYYGGAYPRENAEANSFDASFVKLRELSLSYTLPKRITKSMRVHGATVSLVGNNVALWTDVPNIDPEAQALNGGVLIPGFEVTQLPSTRAFGFKLNFDF
jgi:TonB-linked SusC/RagA family outer membrane protein